MKKKIIAKKEQVNEPLKDGERFTEKQMLRLLTELGYTRFFDAIKQYNNDRRITLDQMLRVIDPVSEPGRMARHQGIYAGLEDLENAIELLKEKSLDGDQMERSEEIV